MINMGVDSIKSSIVFDLVYANNTILSYFFFCFFVLIDLYLIPAVFTQTFNPNAELAMPTGILTNEANA